MQLLIIIGTIISAVGLVGLILSALRVLKARKAGLDEEALRAAIAKAMTLNIGAFFLSAFGLVLVVVGVILA